MRVQGFTPPVSPTFEPLADGSFADAQGLRNRLLFPALLFQIPGSFPAFFTPI